MRERIFAIYLCVMAGAYSNYMNFIWTSVFSSHKNQWVSVCVLA